MNKHQIIEQIRNLNPTASNEFLEAFSECDLSAYLRHLKEVTPARLQAVAVAELDSN